MCCMLDVSHLIAPTLYLHGFHIKAVLFLFAFFLNIVKQQIAFCLGEKQGMLIIMNVALGTIE